MPAPHRCQNCGQDFDAPRAYCSRCGAQQLAAKGGKLGSWAVALSIAFLAASIWYFAGVISADRQRRDVPATTTTPAALLSTPTAAAAPTTPAPTRAPTRAPATPSPTPTTPPSVYAPEPAEEDEDEITVYVTRTGAKYHRGSCRYLSRSKIPMPLAEARLGYDPCSVCDPPE
jgi:hypothetical protein